jgi:hypothetical protein
MNQTGLEWASAMAASQSWEWGKLGSGEGDSFAQRSPKAQRLLY